MNAGETPVTADGFAALGRRAVLSAFAAPPFIGAGARAAMIDAGDDPPPSWSPAKGLPDSKVGTFTQALYDQAAKDDWRVISMKDDWKRVFSFE